MKNLRKTMVLTAVSAALTITSANLFAADLAQLKDKGVIRIAVANEIPYGYADLNGDVKGAGPEVATRVLKNIGIDKIEWQVTNFSSLIPGLQADRFDMVAAEMAILPQRCKTVMFSEPNSSYGEGLLVPAGNPNGLKSYEDFVESSYKLAIMAGADQLEMMQALGMDESRLVTIATNSDAISTVATGRADAYAATGQTAAGLAGQSNKVEVVEDFTDPVINGETVRSWGGFTFSQGSDALRDAVSEELARFKQTPEWAEIMERNGFVAHDREESFKKTTQELCDG